MIHIDQVMISKSTNLVNIGDGIQTAENAEAYRNHVGVNTSFLASGFL